MNKKFTKLIAALALLSFLTIPTGMWGQEVTLDFTSNTWGLPVGSSNGATQSATFTDSQTGYTITLAATTKYYYNSDGYLLFGKSGSTLTLPAFTFDVDKIVVTGRSGASGSVKQNIFVGTTAVSTETTGAAGTNTYNIAAANQAAGSVYVLKVTSAHNTQVTKIEIFKKEASAVAVPTISPAGCSFETSQSVTITPASGTTMYYTTDGTAPTDSGTGYTTAQTITLNATATVKAVSYSGTDHSTIVSETYTKLGNIEDITADNQTRFVKGTVVAKSAKGFVLGDGTGYVYYYKGSAPDQNVNDVISLYGTTSSHNNVIQFPESSTIDNASTSSYNDTPAVQVLNADGITAYNSGLHLSDYVQIQGTLRISTGSNTYYNIEVSGLTNTASISYPTSDQATALTDLENQEVIVKGYFAGVSSGHFNVILGTVEAVATTTHNVTFSVNPSEAGAVTVNGITTSPASVAEGATINISATAVSGYVFSSWTVSGATVADHNDANTTLTMSTADATLTANFTALPFYTVTFNAGDGTFQGNTDFPNTNNTTVYAGEYTLPSATRTGYTFNGWRITGDTQLYTGSYTVSGDVDFTADYTENTSGAGGTDCLDNASTGISGTSYESWTAIGSSGAEYAGQSAGGTNTSGSCIQIRSSNSNSGIVTTTSGGKALKVSVEWNNANSSDRTLNIYGSHTAYTSPADLYGTNPSSELIGNIVFGTSTELNIIGDYEYIGIRSASGAAYLDEICIEWGGASSVSAPTINGQARFVESQEITIDVPDGTEVYYTIDGTTPNPTASPIVGSHYTGPFTITGTTTVNAIAYDETNTSSVTSATFTRVYTITLTQTAGGVISADVEQAAEGETVTLTATPNVGYSFGGWTADPASTTLIPNANTTPATFTMSTDNVIVTATFTTATAYTVLFNINGKVEMTATVNAGNTIDLSKFVADVTTDGYTFDGWYTAATGGEKKTGDFTPDAAEVTLYAQFAAASADNYALVTDASQLVAGNLVVIAANGTKNTAMSKTQNNNNRPETEESEEHIIKSSDQSSMTINSNYTDVCEFVLGGSTGEWTFKDTEWGSTGGYLYAKGPSGKNYLYTQAENDDNGKWSISVGTTGEATLTAQGTNTYNVLQRNTSAHVFSCYNSTQQSVFLYTKPAAKSVKGTRDNVTAKSKITEIASDVMVTVKSTGVVYLTGSNNGNTANLIVEDGGQLVTPNPVAATVHKSIEAYTIEQTQGDNLSNGWYLIASPMASTTFNNTANTNLASGSYDLYAYDPSKELEWRNFEYSDNNLSTLNAGQGYLYANSNNLDLLFMGTLNTGINDVGGLPYVENNTIKSLYLAGNSLTHEQTFYVYNDQLSSATANILTINGDGNGFNVAPASSFEAAPMQGFFVQAGGTGWTLSTTDLSNLAPGNQIVPAPQINVKVKRMRGAVIDNAIVSLGNAPLMNKFMLNENATKIYVPMGNEEFAVVRAQAEGETPLCFKASENGSYTLVVELKDVEMSYLHLIDNMTGADVDLLATPSYSFEAKTSDYASRFRLVFSANNGANENGNETFAYYNGSEWVISNMGDATLQVVDVMGRVLSSETVSGNANVSLNQTPGVYMLRLVNSDSVKTQKIVVR